MSLLLGIAGKRYILSADNPSCLKVQPQAQLPKTEQMVELFIQNGQYGLGSATGFAELSGLLERPGFWRSLEHADAQALCHLLGKAEREAALGKDDSKTLAAAYMLEFLILASRLSGPWVPPSGPWSVDDARRYIDENYAERFSLEFFVDKCAMNTSDFSRRFKERAGCPLFEYINTRRVKRACSLLKTSSLPITEIAQEVGYNSLSFFNRYFVRIVGLSPRAYRDSIK